MNWTSIEGAPKNGQVILTEYGFAVWRPDIDNCPRWLACKYNGELFTDYPDDDDDSASLSWWRYRTIAPTVFLNGFEMERGNDQRN